MTKTNVPTVAELNKRVKEARKDELLTEKAKTQIQKISKVLSIHLELLSFTLREFPQSD